MSVPRLKMIRGPEPGREYELYGDTITIGRGNRNEIIIRDHEVSKEHCRLVRVLDDYELHDLKSTNGTFVNGQRVDENGWLLSGGQLVELGYSILLEFLASEPSGITNIPLPPEPQKSIAHSRFYLIVQRTGASTPDDYALDGEVLSLGRGMDNDIIIPEPEVSKKHLRFLRTHDGEYILEDIGSLNGTYINDVRVVENIKLKMGDIIRVGTRLEMTYATEPSTQRRKTDTLAVNPLRRQPERRTETTSAIQSPTNLEGENSNMITSMASGVPDLSKHVFITYDRADWEGVVSRLFTNLLDSKVPVWVNQHLTPESDSWQVAQTQALDECACLLVIVTPASMGIAHIRQSIQHFLVRAKPLLLLEYKETALPITLQKTPFVKYDPQNPGRTFNAIQGELRKMNVFR